MVFHILTIAFGYGSGIYMTQHINMLMLPDERIQSRIYLIRGKKVMFDHDLAELYEVETKNLKRAVNRNANRFPEDFMFQLREEEMAQIQDERLRCQFGTLQKSQHFKYAPYVFTEQGIAMLSSVLHSERAILVNIQIIRTFTKLRELMASNKELREKIEQLEGKYDEQFRAVFEIIKRLIDQEEEPKALIGFHS